jgi:hypothetical protein
MRTKKNGEMTVREIFDAIDSGLAEVSQRLASGDLDGAGRYDTDAALPTTRVKRTPARPVKEAAA